MNVTSQHGSLLALIRDLHFAIHDAVRARLFAQDGRLFAVANEDGDGDVSYNIDIASEETIEHFFSCNPIEGGIVLISEGSGKQVYPAAINESEARYRLLIDPIDGTREIMYNKRSAWVITAVAYNRGDATNLSDVFLSVQTELPVKKQTLASFVYAEKGSGAWEEIWDIGSRTMTAKAERLQPSQSKSIDHGYAVFSNYFPGVRDAIALFADTVLSKIGIEIQNDKAIVFDDQYISSGGQIYLLASGAYRFAADIRPALTRISNERGIGLALCCHPYDIGGLLIFLEAGGIMTDLTGKDITYPIDTQTRCGWLAYANNDIRNLMEPAVLAEIQKIL